MAKGILGKKVGMTQVFDDAGKSIPVTIVQAGPCTVTEVKTPEKHGYSGLQVGFVPAKEKHLTKAMTGHFKKNGVQPFRKLTEFRDSGLDLKEGSEISVSLFEPGDLVKVTGISKGKGFQGVMKRHGFGGGRMTHGSHFHRAPGSTGAGTTPGRVFKGKRMPGHAGAKTQTTMNLKIMAVDAENNVLLIKGALPGPVHSIVKVEAL